jgi:hypothetical protein
MKTPRTRTSIGRSLMFVAGIAALALSASASAWWGGYDRHGWRCDPQMAYLEEYGFLDYYGPSQSDMQRLHRDQWMATYYGDWRRDPYQKALRNNCPGYSAHSNRGWRGPYGW